MYLRILKKDLKRKRTMNVILLLFITLATMFVASSVNNIISVTTALDHYFEMANAPAYLGATMNKGGGGNPGEVLERMETVDAYRMERIIYMSADMVTSDNNEVEIFGGTMLLQGDKDLALNYFLADNSVLKAVAPGELYMTGHMMEKQKFSVGDRITITIEGKSKEFRLAGSVNDAVLGASSLSITRYIVAEEDYSFFTADEKLFLMNGGELCYIETADTDAMLTELGDAGGSFIFSMDWDYMRFCYIFDMIVTGILLAVSVLLIVISFVVLRFTIIFTLSEEFREIGVMKAIGIKNRKIRGLYLVKYALLAVVGAIIGLALSYPFGTLLQEVSSKSVILSGESAYGVNVLCSVAVVAVILLFSYGCTRKVTGFTPVDAIRNGQTGERFRKKSLMSLGKSRLGTTGFLAMNDIVSSPKRYSIVTLTFSLCLCITLMLSATASTLKSEKVLPALDMVESHAIVKISGGDVMSFMTEDGRAVLEAYLAEMEETLSAHGMQASCVQDLVATFTVKYGNRESQISCFQATGVGIDQFARIEGTSPQAPGEIAMTRRAAESIGAGIGDTVVIVSMEGEREYLITALYQTMNNRGQALRFHEDEEINYIQVSGGMSTQIVFHDTPDKKEVEARIETINTFFEEYGEVISVEQCVKDMIGVADSINAIKGLMTGLTMVMIVLVTVLLERSFIAKETKEIALMKAMGLRNGRIFGYHVARFAIVGVVAVLFAELLLRPFLRLCIDPIFRMMGMEVAVDYAINPIEVYVVLPLVVLGTTMITAFLTVLYTKKIKAADVAGLE